MPLETYAKDVRTEPDISLATESTLDDLQAFDLRCLQGFVSYLCIGLTQEFHQRGSPLESSTRRNSRSGHHSYCGHMGTERYPNS